MTGPLDVLMSLLDIDIAGLQENIAANFWMGTVRKKWHRATHNSACLEEFDRTSSKPKSSFSAELSGNPGDGGNPAEDSAVTFTEKNQSQQYANNGKSWQTYTLL